MPTIRNLDTPTRDPIGADSIPVETDDGTVQYTVSQILGAGSPGVLTFGTGGYFSASPTNTYDGRQHISVDVDASVGPTGNKVMARDSSAGISFRAAYYYNAAGTHYVSVSAPSALGANVALIWPGTDGDAGQAVITDGAGNLSWGDFASTAYVTAQINALINAAPGVLDTLDELAAALGDDADFASTMTTALAGKLPLAGGTMSGDINFAGHKAISPKVQSERHAVETPAISGGTLTLDLSKANVFDVAWNANITTLTISDPPASGTFFEFLLNLTQDATGSRTLTVPATCKPNGGTPLTLDTGANKVSTLYFRTYDGTNYLMNLAGKSYA